MEENTNNTTTTTTYTIDHSAITADIPVIFYDGEREIELGKLQVLSTMTFKIFQTLLSSKIGISPHQITIYFERVNNHGRDNHHHHRRRHPVTNKFDFRALVSDMELVSSAFFWVVLKRARRNRRRRNNGYRNSIDGKVQNGGFDDGFVLLRRDVNDLVYLEHLNRVRMMMELEAQRENYLMSLNLNSNVYNELSGLNLNLNLNLNDDNNYHHYGNNDYDYGESVLSKGSSDDYDVASCSTGGGSSDRVFCDVCYNYSSGYGVGGGGGGGDTVPFHWCRNDIVTTGFRSSPAGPIARPPSKNKFLA